MLSTLLTLKFRERCMDLVSFESPEEYRHFALMLHRGERFSLQYRWLSAFLWLHVQTTSAQSGRLGGNATSGTRAATLRNFSRSTSTDGSFQYLQFLWDFQYFRSMDGVCTNCILANTGAQCFPHVSGSGLMETKESHRPTSQASSHFGAGKSQSKRHWWQKRTRMMNMEDEER